MTSNEDPSSSKPDPTDDEPVADPTDTDHPTGEDQVAENLENDPPS
jgi:hypothetical protein